jgi:hypothetical protein
MTEIVDVADLDCIYLSYDEPQKEEFWAHIQNMVPWAKRVDGVEGSDAAHKAAAESSDTDRFILIDGDNLPYESFFNQQLKLDSLNKECVFRWRAVNEINGLMYGNGGMSCWTKDFVLNMKTHEHSDGDDETNVEFCFDDRYWAMHNVYSTTYPNGTPFQAWRAGFREGVKMCLDRGRKPSVEEFKDSVHKQNLNNLKIWQTIGQDVDNGAWAILGARMGTVKTMLEDWDHTQVQWFPNLEQMWNQEVSALDCDKVSKEYMDALNKQLDMGISEYSAQQSKFFKEVYRQTHVQKSVMTTEKDFITER